MKKKSSKKWINEDGYEIPLKYISVHEKKREALVDKAFKKVEKLEAQMKKAKAEVLDAVDNFVTFIKDEDIINKRNKKGNMALMNFSGDKKIKIDINDIIQYDERLGVAKSIIDDVLIEMCDKLGGQADAIKTIFQQAFNVDKQGNVNRYMLKRLCKIELKNERWEKAVRLIRESENVIKTKEYIQFFKRDSVKNDFDKICLNFSAMSVDSKKINKE